jgi:hypothetical protein
MAKYSGSLSYQFFSGSEAFPNSLFGGYAANEITGTATPTKFFARLSNQYNSGSEAFTTANPERNDGGFLAKKTFNALQQTLDFTPTKFSSSLSYQFFSGSEASGENITGFSASAGGNREDYMLAGGYVATKLQTDNVPPFVTSSNPASDSADIPVESDVQFLFDDAFEGTQDFFGGSAGVLRDSIHVRFQIGNDFNLENAIISGTFQSGYNGINSSFVPSGSLDIKGLYNGWFITIDREDNWPPLRAITIQITGSDSFGNLYLTSYVFTIQSPEGCPDIIGQFVSTDYTIVEGAKALREYQYQYANGLCNKAQAPYNLMVPGVIRLRTQGFTPYTNVKSGNSFNQRNGTFFPVGVSSSQT